MTKFNMNPKEGLNFLIEEGIIEDTPESICDFLSNVSGLSKRRLGEYFGRVSGVVRRTFGAASLANQQPTRKSGIHAAANRSNRFLALDGIKGADDSEHSSLY